MVRQVLNASQLQPYPQLQPWGRYVSEPVRPVGGISTPRPDSLPGNHREEKLPGLRSDNQSKAMEQRHESFWWKDRSNASPTVSRSTSHAAGRRPKVQCPQNRTPKFVPKQQQTNVQQANNSNYLIGICTSKSIKFKLQRPKQIRSCAEMT